LAERPETDKGQNSTALTNEKAA